MSKLDVELNLVLSAQSKALLDQLQNLKVGGAAGGAGRRGSGEDAIFKNLAGAIAAGDLAARVAIGTFEKLAASLESVVDSGLKFQQAIVGIAAILQATTTLTGPGGSSLSLPAQLAEQTKIARSIQLTARKQLLPLGIAGEREAVLVQAVISGAAQKGIILNAQQAATVSARFGAAATAINPALLSNTTQLRKDVTDILAGLPQAQKTSLGAAVRPILGEIKRATTGEELISATDKLQAFVTAVKGSDQAFVGLLKLSGSIDQLKTVAGDALLQKIVPGLNALADALMNPGLQTGVSNIAEVVGQAINFVTKATAKTIKFVSPNSGGGFLDNLKNSAISTVLNATGLPGLSSLFDIFTGQKPNQPEDNLSTGKAGPEEQLSGLKQKFTEMEKEEGLRKKTISTLTPEGRAGQAAIEIQSLNREIANLSQQAKLAKEEDANLLQLQIQGLEVEKQDLMVKKQLAEIEGKLAGIYQDTLVGKQKALPLQLDEEELQGKITHRVRQLKEIQGERGIGIGLEEFGRSRFNTANLYGRLFSDQSSYMSATQRAQGSYGQLISAQASGNPEAIEQATKNYIQDLKEIDSSSRAFAGTFLELKQLNEQTRDAQLAYTHTIEDANLQFNNLTRNLEASQDALDEFKDNLEATFQTEEERALTLAQQIKAQGGDIPSFLDVSPEDLKAKHLESQQTQLDAMLQGFGLGGAPISSSGISFIGRDIDTDFAQGRFQRGLGRQQGAAEDNITKVNYEFQRLPEAIQHAREAFENFSISKQLKTGGVYDFLKQGAESYPLFNSGSFGTTPNLNTGTSSMTDQVRMQISPLVSPNQPIPAPTSGQPRDQHSHTDRIVTAVENLRSQMPSLVATGVSQGNQASFG